MDNIKNKIIGNVKQPKRRITYGKRHALKIRDYPEIKQICCQLICAMYILTNIFNKAYTNSNNSQRNFMVKDGKGGAKTLTGLNFEEKI